MQFQTNANPYNYGAGAFTQYAPETKPVVMNQVLTADEVAFLKKTKPAFGGKMSKEEYLRALCCHKEENKTGGNYTLTHDEKTDLHTCSICGESFHLLDLYTYDMSQIENICNDFNDLFQTIKTFYGAVPTDAGREIYVIGGLIKRFPQMYKVAAEYFKSTNQDGTGLARANMGGMHNSVQAMFSSLFGNPTFAGSPMGATGGWGAPQAPVAPQRPVLPAGWTYDAAGNVVPANTVPDPRTAAPATPGVGAGMFAGSVPQTPVGFVDVTGGSTMEKTIVSPDVKAGCNG